MNLYRHKKRGTTYVLLGVGKIQSEHWVDTREQGDSGEARPVDMQEVAIYVHVDGINFKTRLKIVLLSKLVAGLLCARPRAEFEDGRFEKLEDGKWTTGT